MRRSPDLTGRSVHEQRVSTAKGVESPLLLFIFRSAEHPVKTTQLF